MTLIEEALEKEYGDDTQTHSENEYNGSKEIETEYGITRTSNQPQNTEDYNQNRNISDQVAMNEDQSDSDSDIEILGSNINRMKNMYNMEQSPSLQPSYVHSDNTHHCKTWKPIVLLSAYNNYQIPDTDDDDDDNNGGECVPEIDKAPKYTQKKHKNRRKDRRTDKPYRCT